MADESVVFTPRYMLGVLEKMEPEVTIFLDRWCKDAPPQDTDIVDLDKKRGRRSVSPYVNPTDEATKLVLQGYDAKTLKLPYLKEQVVITSKDLQQRAPGTVIYSPQGTYASRAEIKAGEAMRELEKRFSTTDEVAFATGLQTGKIPIVGPNINAEVDLNMPAANLVTLSGTALWSDHTNADPLANLRSWKRIPTNSGGRLSSVCYMGATAADNFLQCAKMTNKLDNRRVVIGQINPMDMPNDIEYLGTAAGLDIYVNYNRYIDQDGNEQYFMNPKKVLVGPPSTMAIRHFGAIYNLNAIAVVRRYPSSWTKKDGSARVVQLETASLPIPYEIEDFVCAGVLA